MVEIAINAPVHHVQFMGFGVDTDVDAESLDGKSETTQRVTPFTILATGTDRIPGRT